MKYNKIEKDLSFIKYLLVAYFSIKFALWTYPFVEYILDWVCQ